MSLVCKGQKRMARGLSQLQYHLKRFATPCILAFILRSGDVPALDPQQICGSAFQPGQLSLTISSIHLPAGVRAACFSWKFHGRPPSIPYSCQSQAGREMDLDQEAPSKELACIDRGMTSTSAFVLPGVSLYAQSKSHGWRFTRFVCPAYGYTRRIRP